MFDDEDIFHYVMFEFYRKFQSIRCDDDERLTYTVTSPVYLTEYGKNFIIYIDQLNISLRNTTIIPALKSCGAYERHSDYISRILGACNVDIINDELVANVPFDANSIRVDTVISAADRLCRAIVALDALAVLYGKPLVPCEESIECAKT